MCFSVVGSLLPVLAGRGPSCFGSLVRFPGPVVLPGSFLFGRRPKYLSFWVSLYERRARFEREVRLHAYVGLVVFFALFSLFLFFFVVVVGFP